MLHVDTHPVVETPPAHLPVPTPAARNQLHTKIQKIHIHQINRRNFNSASTTAGWQQSSVVDVVNPSQLVPEYVGGVGVRGGGRNKSRSRVFGSCYYPLTSYCSSSSTRTCGGRHGVRSCRAKHRHSVIYTPWMSHCASTASPVLPALLSDKVQPAEIWRWGNKVLERNKKINKTMLSLCRG